MDNILKKFVHVYLSLLPWDVLFRRMCRRLVCGWHSLISTLQNSCEVIGDFYFLESFIFETFEEYDILLSILLASFSLEGIYFHINWDEHREESLDAKMEREVFSSGCIMFRAQETVSHLKSEVLI